MEYPKYALAENERRFLAVMPDDLRRRDHVLIEDLYVTGTRLRLRSVTDSRTGDRVYKFCKKYPWADDVSRPIVNMYLSDEEFALLCALPGRRLTKQRYRLEHEGHGFGIDVFQGALDGLVLSEVEKPTREALSSVAIPDWVICEVTEDGFFSGGNLCDVTAEGLRDKLASISSALASWCLSPVNNRDPVSDG